MWPQLERAEIARATRKATDSLDSYDCYLRGMADFHRGGRESILSALSMFREAMTLDPEFAAAHGMAAWCYFWRRTSGWTPENTAEAAEGARLARRAVDLGRADAIALTRGAHALAHFGGDLSECIELLERARRLNPNLAAAWFLGGYLRLWNGEPETAIERFAHAIRLSPLDSGMHRMQMGMAVANLLLGEFDIARRWATKAAPDYPD